jgi:hypothetical protein
VLSIMAVIWFLVDQLALLLDVGLIDFCGLSFWTLVHWYLRVPVRWGLKRLLSVGHLCCSCVCCDAGTL